MSLKEKLQEFGDVLENQYMKYHTTFRIGGKVRYFFYPFSVQDLQCAMKIIKEYDYPYKVMGKGSNVLWCDESCDMIVIFPDHYMHGFNFEEDILEAEAGCSIIALAVAAKERSLSKLEFASGIPGSVGGCVFMNAGAYRSEMSEIVEEVQILRDGELVWVNKLDMQFGYRTSILKQHPDWIVTKVRLRLQQGDKDEIEEVMNSRRDRRMETQPLDKPSAGSTFKNPEEMPAWQCIENVGLRGHSHGGAAVSNKHCNFLINAGEATCADMKSLIKEIQDKVKEELNIELVTEVEQFTWQKRKKTSSTQTK